MAKPFSRVNITVSFTKLSWMALKVAFVIVVAPAITSA
jgi:hypothetical protein